MRILVLAGTLLAALVPPGVALSAVQLDAVHAATAAVRQERSGNRTIAITIDDLPAVSVTGNGLETAERITRDLLAALRRAAVPAIGFVNEQKLQPAGDVDTRRVALLQQWIDAGFELGNHTFSHPDLHVVDPSAYEEDIVRGEVVTRRLMATAGRPLKYFRHPFLRTGRSAGVRARITAFLADRGYVVAPVTIDNSDYVFAAAYDRAHAAGDVSRAARIADTYLDYMASVVEYYEAQSIVIVGRPISHTLLLHANALNADTIERLLGRLKGRGYGFVTLDEALKDPAYASKDEFFGPGGITWLHRWALTAGLRGIFAGEPAVPDWIAQAAR